MHCTLRPIGIIRTPFTDPQDTPIQAARSRALGHIEVEPELVEGLRDLEGFSHLHLLCIFHKTPGFALHVRPFLDDRQHGVFATRYPRRPNPLGISILSLVCRDTNSLTVEGVDMLDGTPLLDIKPYVPDFDVRANARTGWYETRSIS